MMTLQHIPVHPYLKGYVEKIWIFESAGKVPDDDLKLIVPNGLPKLVIPFRNGLDGRMEGWRHLSGEHSMTIIGICDLPSVVDVVSDSASGTIGVEFSPMGISRFLHVRQSEIKNRIYPLADVLGKVAAEIEERIAQANDTEQKVKLVQFFLMRLFNNNRDDIFEYCINRIRASKGTVQVKQLERETGYSSRWLTMKFDEKLGISPKNLCSVVRFHTVYQALAFDVQHDIYDFYYDQSHFIKDFRRFTGLSPRLFERQANEFDKIFYR